MRVNLIKIYLGQEQWAHVVFFLKIFNKWIKLEARAFEDNYSSDVEDIDQELMKYKSNFDDNFFRNYISNKDWCKLDTNKKVNVEIQYHDIPYLERRIEMSLDNIRHIGEPSIIISNNKQDKEYTVDDLFRCLDYD